MAIFEIIAVTAILGAIRGVIEFWPELRSAVAKKWPAKRDCAKVGGSPDTVGIIGEDATVIDGSWREVPPTLQEAVNRRNVGK